MKVWASGHSGIRVLFFALYLGSRLVLTVAPSGTCACWSRQCGRWADARCLSFVFRGPECHGFGCLLPDTHHLLEMALNYSNLDLSKIGTLTWRLEERRLDFFPSWDSKCKENRTFWINELFEAVGGLPIRSSFTKLNLFFELFGGKIFLR